MTERDAGAVGLSILAVVFLFIWWWFGLRTVLTILVVSVVALVALGVAVSSRR
jgi:hypothetical protein